MVCSIDRSKWTIFLAFSLIVLVTSGFFADSGQGNCFRHPNHAGREADHSPPSSAEVKNTWSYTSTPQYSSTAWFLAKHRDNFALNFTTKCKRAKDKITETISHVFRRVGGGHFEMLR
jgi:hypothetical protein